jgi:hypothetical protein
MSADTFPKPDTNGWTSSHPLEHRRRFGGPAANRYADDRRHGFIDRFDADRHSAVYALNKARGWPPAALERNKRPAPRPRPANWLAGGGLKESRP